MRKLNWSPAAESDLWDIADRYGDIDPELAILILERVKTAPLPLLDYPAMGSPTRWPGLRKWRAHRTPFVLLYRSAGDSVTIGRVVDVTSDWQRL